MSVSFQVGHYYRVKFLKPSVDLHYRRKLMAMGMVPGSQFMVKRIVPWGGPLQLEMNGGLLSVRQNELLSAVELETL